MAKGNGIQQNWPTPDEAVAKARELGTSAAVARALGKNPRTFDSWVERNPGLKERINEAKLAHAAEQRTPQVVADPEHRKAEEQAAELKALRKENKSLSDAVVKQEGFFDRIVEATKVPVKVPKYRTKVQAKAKPARSAICPIFDQQFGQFVRPTDTPGGRGAYSVAVFDRRLARWVEGATSIIAKQSSGYRIEELIIPFGGDHVEGDEIFAGQAWQLELDPCRQVWELSLKMDTAIREVVRFAREEVGVKHIALYGVDDNHGKVGGKKSGARPATYSWNWLFLKILFDRLRAEPIDEFAIEPGGALFFHCAGHQFQLIHGHQIRGWGGIPFYGLAKFDSRSIRLHNTIFRYLLLGHHHQPAEIPNGSGESIISGDWCGANNLSGVMTAASRPRQNVIFVGRKWGITSTERIWFTEADEAYAEPGVYGQAAA